MNPAQNDFAEKDAERLGQFLIQLDDNRLVQELLQFEGMPRVERSAAPLFTKGSHLLL